MKLEGARVLITGGGTGIGKATARRLVEAGAQVAICGRRPETIAAAASELGVLGAAADVGDELEVEGLFEAVLNELGGLDVLINNAGFGEFAPLVETDKAAFERVFRTNVTGAMLAGRAAARHFIANGGGAIVNVGSTASAKGYAGGTAYAASKFALAGMTECWRAELRPHDIRVMQVDPSEVQTPFGGRPERAKSNPKKLFADDVAQLICNLLALDDRGFVPRVSLWATNPF